MDLKKKDIQFLQGQYRDARKQFLRTFQQTAKPGLLEAGFTKRGPVRYSRVVGDKVDALDIQDSVYGGECCINLGVHYSFLPAGAGDPRDDLENLHPTECKFHRRLAEEGKSDRWWKYGHSEQEARDAVAHILSLLKDRGFRFFDRFSDLVGLFGKITPEEIAAGDLSRFAYPMPRANAALVMAYMMKHWGNREMSRKFAEVGLKLRTNDRAIISKSALERLRDST